MSKPKNIKQAMENDSYIVSRILFKYTKRIRVDFMHKFNNSKIVSFWIDRNYFQSRYPNTYDRF